MKSLKGYGIRKRDSSDFHFDAKSLKSNLLANTYFTAFLAVHLQPE
jgi:hypothetical protein